MGSRSEQRFNNLGQNVGEEFVGSRNSSKASCVTTISEDMSQEIEQGTGCE